MKATTRYLIFGLFILTLGFGWSSFQTIAVQKWLQIGNNSGDTLYSISSGTIGVHGNLTINGNLRASSFVGDTNFTAPNVWNVSPGYSLNIYRHTAKTITDAIANIDSGTIFVHPGIYSNARIIAKSNVTIIGDSPEKCFINVSKDTSSIYCYQVTNFSMKNLTIINDASGVSTPNVTAIKLYRCFSDSGAAPQVFFNNLKIYCMNQNNDSTFGIVADSSSFYAYNCYIFVNKNHNVVGGTRASCIKLQNLSHPIISFCQLHTQTGNDVGIRLIAINCRPAVYNCQIYATGIYSIGGSVTLRTANNISYGAFFSISDFFTTTNNIVDANFILR